MPRISLFKLAAFTFLLVNIIWTQFGPKVSTSRFSDQEMGQVLFSAWTSELQATTPEEAAEMTINALTSQSSDIFALTSSDIQETFGEDAWEQAQSELNIDISTVKQTSEIEIINEEWAEFLVEISLIEGSVHKFLVVLYKEDGVWSIFGTVNQ